MGFVNKNEGKTYIVDISKPHTWDFERRVEPVLYDDEMFVRPKALTLSDELTLKFEAPAGAIKVNIYDRGVHVPYPGIKEVIFNGETTIVFFNDGGKEVVKCDENDEYNSRVAVMAAMLKHIYGNKWIDDIDSVESGDGRIKVKDFAIRNIGEAIENLVSGMITTAMDGLIEYTSRLACANSKKMD